MIEVERLRPEHPGPALLEIVRRIGGREWEDALGLRLEEDVSRILFYVVPTPNTHAGDLSRLLATARAASPGIVIELTTPASPEEEACFEHPLSQASTHQLGRPAQGMVATVCGRFVIVRRADTPPPRPSPSSAARRALELVDEAPDLRVRVVVGPEMVDSAACVGQVTPLAGWQVATVHVGQGITLRGRYHAATTMGVPTLERCVADGLGGFTGVPLLAQLELGGLLSEGSVSRDPSVPTDVRLDVPFSFSQFDMMLGVLELLGEGVQSDTATE
jgi:hypothetical protein